MSSEDQATPTHQPRSHAPDAHDPSLAREEKRARYQEFVRRAAEAVDQDRIQARNRFVHLIGPKAFAALQQDREAVERALDAPDPRWRRCAVYLMKEHWNAGPDFAGRCERMAWEDPDNEVRELALAVLTGHYHFGTNDQRLALRLAELVRCEHTPPAVRYGAYLGLFWLQGRVAPEEGYPSREHFADDVNWAFVDAFLAGG